MGQGGGGQFHRCGGSIDGGGGGISMPKLRIDGQNGRNFGQYVQNRHLNKLIDIYINL